jgi:hypothetical protein
MRSFRRCLTLVASVAILVGPLAPGHIPSLGDEQPDATTKARTPLQQGEGHRTRPPELSDVYDRVREVCDQLCPSARISDVAADSAVLGEYRTREFQVYTIYKGGQIAELPHQERGPEYDGFLLRVTLQPGQYQGAAVIPQNLRHPYWTTYLNAVSVPDKDEHLHIQLSYGSRTDRELLEQLKVAVGVKPLAAK